MRSSVDRWSWYFAGSLVDWQFRESASSVLVHKTPAT
jgi:hypothetical protein